MSGQVRERLRGAMHVGVKRALAVFSSHNTDVDLEAVSDGYVMPEDDEEADEEVVKLFKEEVVPPTPFADAGDPEP